MALKIIFCQRIFVIAINEKNVCAQTTGTKRRKYETRAPHQMHSVSNTINALLGLLSASTYMSPRSMAE